MTYTVKAGDTLSKIAKITNCSTDQLLKANPRIKDPNKIKVGDVLTLPNGLSELTTDNKKPLPPPAPVTPPAPSVGGALGQALADALGEVASKYATAGRGAGGGPQGSG